MLVCALSELLDSGMFKVNSDVVGNLVGGMRLRYVLVEEVSEAGLFLCQKQRN